MNGIVDYRLFLIFLAQFDNCTKRFEPCTINALVKAV